MTLRRITYISTRDLNFDDAAVAAMVAKAQRDNALNDITGLLVSNGLNFLQTFEGPPPAVEQLLKSIVKDARHTGVRICEDCDAEQRLFARWRMEHATADADSMKHRTTATDWNFEREIPATSELAQLYAGFLRLARA